MADLDRTHPLAQDLDWLPAGLKVRRWLTTAGTWAGTAAVATAVTVASAGLLGHIAAVAAAGGILLGAQAGRVRLRRDSARLARGKMDLGALDRQAEGRLVHVAGRIQASVPFHSLLHALPAVYRRVTFRHGWRRFVHEAAVDFDLVDADGERITVHVDGARLCVPPALELADYPAAVLAGGAILPSLEALWGPGAAGLIAAGRPVPAAEVFLGAGVMVEIIGYKTRTVDPTAGGSLGRAPPMRAALRSGRIPLIVTPAAPTLGGLAERAPGDGLDTGP